MRAARTYRRGVVAVEFALLLVGIGLPFILGVAAVSEAIGNRWPGVTLLDVVVELIDFAAERIVARRALP